MSRHESSRRNVNNTNTHANDMRQNDEESMSNGVDSDRAKKDRGVGWWHEDRSSVLLLLFLYVLQGLPLGLAGSIPMILAVSKRLVCIVMMLFGYRFWCLKRT